MIAQIKLKDLLKFINPFENGVSYNNEHYVVDLKKLKNFIQHPKQNNIFNPSNKEDAFYSNLAFYIINSDKNNQEAISLDFNQEKIIQQGLFEFIKSVYLNQSNVFIHFDNLDYVKTLFKSLNNNIDNNIQNVAIAKDTNYLTNNLNLNSISDTIKIKNSLQWDSFNIQDLYSNQDYILEEIKKINQKSIDSSENLSRIKSLIPLINKNLLENPEFHVQLLKLQNSNINLLLFSDLDLFKFDINSKELETAIFEDLQKGSLSILQTVYNYVFRNFSNQKNNKFKSFSFSKFANHPFMIDFFINKVPTSRTNNYGAKDVLDISFFYNLLNDENKNNLIIIKNYIKSVSYRQDNVSSIQPDDLFAIPLTHFNNQDILNLTIRSIPFDKIKPKIINEKTTIEGLEDTSFLIKNINNLYPHQINDILFLFTPKEKINKEFFCEIISQNPSFFGFIQEPSNWPTPTFYSNLLDDINVLHLAVKNGFRLSELKSSLVKPHLIENQEPHLEWLKLSYILTKARRISSYASNIPAKEKEFLQAFKHKYFKKEFSFLFQPYDFQSSDFLSVDGRLPGQLFSIKTKNEIIETIDNIIEIKKNLPSAVKFDSNSFYLNLNPSLKNDSEIISRLASFNLNYSSLTETSQYNKNVIIQFIELKPKKTLAQLSPDFLNDKDIALSIAQQLDLSKIDKNDLPGPLKKFFTNYEVESDFHSFLTKFIGYSSLKTEIKEPNNSKPLTKTKI